MNPGFVKRSLASHSWLGLLVGALLYLVCLSGTIVVFGHELHRWEQPGVAEFDRADPAMVQRAYATLARRNDRPTHHVYIGLPTPETPRMTVSDDSGGFYVEPGGALAERAEHRWTDMVTNLHLYLHLPSSFGMIVVSILGAMLCGLIVSGLCAHPTIFRDAFRFRRGGARRLEQADLHNRLSVWGAPFHLVIAVTGAYFGLAALMTSLIATSEHGGDTAAVEAALFGAPPSLEQPVRPPGIDRALAAMPRVAPGADPFFVTVEEANSPEQYILVIARVAGKFIYSEQYRFDAAGRYLGRAGFDGGAVGKQAVFSTFRLHFGQFGGFAVKLAYAALGLALTIVSVSGVNVWLARRRSSDWIDRVWPGFVWGTPPALALAGIAALATPLSPLAVFWVALVAIVGTGATRPDPVQTARALRLVGGSALLAMVAVHVAVHRDAAFGGAAIGVNLALLALALALLASVPMRFLRHARTRPLPAE
ncbi:hypothetical protein GCM10009106_07660 [Sphingomonas japonica]